MADISSTTVRGFEIKPRAMAATLGALGIVYGDIGTSPLYALKEAATAASVATLRSSGEAILHASEHIEAGSGLADAELDWLEGTVAELAICAENWEPCLKGAGHDLPGHARARLSNLSVQLLRSSARAERGLQALAQSPGGLRIVRPEGPIA